MQQHAMPTLTPEHHRRGGPVLANALALLRARQRDRPGEDVPRYLLERVVNTRDFLDRWPRLQHSHASQHWQLSGRMPRYSGGLGLPGADHTSYWRVRGVRGPIVALTFPYSWTEQQHAEALRFAELRGLTVEVCPPDVPDLWFPGETVPIVWARAGLDWRQLAAGAATAATAATPQVAAVAALAAKPAATAATSPHRGVGG